MRTRILGMPLVYAAMAALVPGAAGAADDEAPTFTKDVAPIFQAKCEACHRANSIAPMSLVTYQESRPWARSIRERVSTRQMPPWHIDRTVGISEFANDRSLSDAEVDTIVRWVDGGAPRGNPADMPPPIAWPDESKWYFAELFGPPDLVIESEPYTMPAEANDAWWKPVSETGLTEPRWVRAIELRPGTTAGRHRPANRLASSNDEKSRTQSALTRKMSLLWRRTNNCRAYSYVLRPSPDHPQSYSPRGCPNGKKGQKLFSCERNR